MEHDTKREKSAIQKRNLILQFPEFTVQISHKNMYRINRS